MIEHIKLTDLVVEGLLIFSKIQPYQYYQPIQKSNYLGHEIISLKDTDVRILNFVEFPNP